MNSLLSMMGGNNFASVMAKAMAAKRAGKTPEQFLKSIAGELPQLKGIDLSNLEIAARSMAGKNGVDIGQAKKAVENHLQGF